MLCTNMDLDGRAYSKLIGVRYSDVNFEEYRRIVDAIGTLAEKHDHETPEMWYSRIHDLFRKIQDLG
ncbi:hypothetical protein GLOIN_2v1834454 [Rhizophagus clarus]|uniref:Uncharacterized protein n=1 Tax=Rhizophagus clarus TaxID=94130 RepID=A0A8H3KS66_9GLOM|nr:hypothetical protein GLOIN_2v1834454 [Rhizophagus clarus]